LNFTLHDLQILELIGHRRLIRLEILIIFLLESLLELFHLLVDLVALEIGQPLLIALGQISGNLIDAVLFQDRRRHLRNRLSNARLIGLS
jgi:hypothetical protein